MRKYKVAFCLFPGDGTLRKEAAAYVVRTVRAMDRDPRISEVYSITIQETPVTMSRNRAIKEAKDNGCDYALFLDSDMSPDLPYPGAVPFWDAAWEFMMVRREQEARAEEDIRGRTFGSFCVEDADHIRGLFPPATVAAPYGGPPPHECVYVFHWAGVESETPNPNFRLEMVPREMAVLFEGIQEAAALPTGLILYDMRVFDVLPPPWFEYEYADPPYNTRKATTEDVYQTRNASLLGLPQYVAWSSWSGHAKVKIVGRPYVITRDQVHATLRDAVLRGVDRGDRIIVLGGNGHGDGAVEAVQRDGARDAGGGPEGAAPPGA